MTEKRSIDNPLQFKISAIIVDIEGTTTSINFVKDTLFTYVRENLKDYVEGNWSQKELKDDIALLRDQANTDVENKLEGAVEIPEGEGDDVKMTVIKSTLWQMDNDRKTKSLKQLQGHIWRNGYSSGKISGHIYDDVKDCIKAWTEAGKKVYIYSSGSVEAQKLLFGNTKYGDLLPMFSGYFDTAIGPKTEASSYTKISENLKQSGVISGANDALFLTDVLKEATAAAEAGLQTAIVIREGNSPLSDDEKEKFPVIESFCDITFEENSKRRKLSHDSEKLMGNCDNVKGTVSCQDIAKESVKDIEMEVCTNDTSATEAPADNAELGKKESVNEDKAGDENKKVEEDSQKVNDDSKKLESTTIKEEASDVAIVNEKNEEKLVNGDEEKNIKVEVNAAVDTVVKPEANLDENEKTNGVNDESNVKSEPDSTNEVKVDSKNDTSDKKLTSSNDDVKIEKEDDKESDNKLKDKEEQDKTVTGSEVSKEPISTETKVTDGSVVNDESKIVVNGSSVASDADKKEEKTEEIKEVNGDSKNDEKINTIKETTEPQSNGPEKNGTKETTEPQSNGPEKNGTKETDESQSIGSSDIKEDCDNKVKVDEKTDSEVNENGKIDKEESKDNTDVDIKEDKVTDSKTDNELKNDEADNKTNLVLENVESTKETDDKKTDITIKTNGTHEKNGVGKEIENGVSGEEKTIKEKSVDNKINSTETNGLETTENV